MRAFHVSRARVLGRAAAVLAALAGLVAVGLALRGLDADRLLASLERSPLLWLALAPPLLGSLVDAQGLRRLAPRLGFGSALWLRVSSDALALTLPSGSVLGEALSIHILRARAGLDLGSALGAVAARKLLLIAAHGSMLVLAAVVGRSALARLSTRLFAAPGLEWAVLALGVSLLALAGLAIGAACRLARDAAEPAGWLRRLCGGVAEARLACIGLREALRAGLVGQVLTLACFFLALLNETAETFLLLTLLGSGLAFHEVASFESALALSRVLLVFLPAGLGVQDLGYLVVLAALGVPDAATLGAAFLVVKRGKELVWALLGFLAFVAGGGHRARSRGATLAAPLGAVAA